jgi:hypothetical protein
VIPAIVLSAMLASSAAPADAKPAPIPERWLLKYAPKDMPALPEAFAKNTWYHRWFPRITRLAWEEWVVFAPETAKRPGTATITRADSTEDHKPRLTVRTVPLAVYGPLVEYDGRLYTASIGRWAHERPTPTDVLDLGSAVELPGHVWYQAASQRAKDDKDGPTWVQEWRLEFADDPRTAEKGTVKVFGFGRETTAAEGEDFAAELKFKRTKQPHEKTWKIEVIPDEGMKLPKSGLPVLAFDPDRDRAFIYDYMILNQMFPKLSPAETPAPKPATDPAVGLMQPPMKKK